MDMHRIVSSTTSFSGKVRQNKMTKQPDRRFHCGLISENRNVLFGISMVMIILFHFSEDYHTAVEADKIGNIPFWGRLVMQYYRYVRSIGVELFVFMAGMGQYYSYSRQPDILNYYKRRATRVLIPYAILAVPFWFMKDAILAKAGAAEYFKDLFFFTFFTDAEHALWFIGFILAMYLILPVVYQLLYKDKKTGILWFVALIAGVIFASEQIRLQDPETYLGVEIALTRIPIFIVGVYAGKWIKEDKKISNLPLWVFTLLSLGLKIFIVKTETGNYIARYTDIFYALALILILTILSQRIIRHIVGLKKVLTLIGAYSLELYMTHVTVRGIFKNLKISTWHVRCYVMVVLLAILLSAGLKKSAESVTEWQSS